MANHSSRNACILAKLEEYGDSLLEDRKKKKMRSIKTEKKQFKSSLLNYKTSTLRKCADRTDHNKMSQLEQKIASSRTLHGTEKHLNDIKERLGLLDNSSQFKADCRGEETVRNHERCEQLPTYDEEKNKIIIFKDPAKRSKKQREVVSDIQIENPSENNPEFNMKSARLDVRKLGVQAMKEKVKKKAKLDLLMKLGAKAPKKGNANYRVLQEQRKRQLAQEREKKEQDRKMGLKVKDSKIRIKRDSNDVVRNLDGQVGKFRYGVQFINEEKTARKKRIKNKR